MKEKTKYNYKKLKTEMTEYLKQMKVIYEEYSHAIELFENSVTYHPELEWFNYSEAVKFIRTWDIINNNLRESQKNLLLAYYACGESYDKMLEAFESDTCTKGSLKVMMCLARKKVKEIYNEKYGNK